MIELKMEYVDVRQKQKEKNVQGALNVVLSKFLTEGPPL